VVDPKTGEVLATANDELTDDMLTSFRGGHRAHRAPSTPTTSIAVRSSPTRCASIPTRNPLEALVEIYRMMRPGEPPTKEAAENLFQNLFFNAERYDLSAVGRMKFNRRVGREEVGRGAACSPARTSSTC
jgi:DNA-directed RNA polymerase subunit beta